MGTEDSCQGLRRPKLESEHLLPNMTEVKNTLPAISVPPYLCGTMPETVTSCSKKTQRQGNTQDLFLMHFAFITHFYDNRGLGFYDFGGFTDFVQGSASNVPQIGHDYFHILSSSLCTKHPVIRRCIF
jgi:hypothetical protein